jgi:hypothetical protein
MAQGATLEERVVAILDSSRDRRALNRPARWISGFATALLLAASALAQVKPDPTLNPTVAGKVPGEPASGGVKSVRKKAERIIIARLVFRGATLQEAVDFLRKKSIDLDNLEENPSEKGVNFVIKSPNPQAAEARLTLSLANVSLMDAATHVALLAGLELVTEQYALVMQPRGMSDPKATLDPENKAAPGPAAAIRRKAETIMIPRLELREATLAESVDFLRRRVRDLDPEKLGVNIVLQNAPNPGPRVTLSLSNVPVLEAVKYVANLANLEVELQPTAIVLKRRKEAPPVATPAEAPVPSIPALERKSDGAAAPAPARDPHFGDVPISISAEETKFENGVAVASGNAKLIHKEITLEGDNLRYVPETRHVQAQGNAVFTRKGRMYSAEHIDVDLETGRAETKGPTRTVIPGR